MAGLVFTRNSNSGNCYTVADVWKNARALSGTRICVQGKAEATVAITATMCCPQSCDCNSSTGELRLISDETTTYNPRVSDIDYITIDSLDCNGNQCSITCSPFNPFNADHFQFIGELSTLERNGEIAWLKLTNIDISASRQSINGIGQTILVETYTQTWPISTPIPNSCEEIK